MKRKIFILTLCFLSNILFLCPYIFGQKHTISVNKCFTLLKATSQSFSPGINGGASGVDYYFTLLINSKESLLFDSVWMGNKAFKVIVTKRRLHISNEPITYTKGDTITLWVTALTLNGYSKKHSRSVAPVKYVGDALLKYRFKTKPYFYTVKKIEFIESQKRL